MTGADDAIGGALALIFGGVLFLLFASELPSVGPINFGFWGAIYLLAGVGLLVVAISAAITALID